MFIGNANILGRRTDGSIVYLLDTYSAAAAYSLRQLKTGVTNVVRVRRSDNAESDFTADEITDGTLTTWTGANDGFVTTLYEQSGSGIPNKAAFITEENVLSPRYFETVSCFKKT